MEMETDSCVALTFDMAIKQSILETNQNDATMGVSFPYSCQT